MNENKVTRRKFVSIIAALALVVSMFSFTSSAFADPSDPVTDGSITLTEDAISVTTGGDYQTFDLKTIATGVPTPSDSEQWHLDFGVATDSDTGYGPTNDFVTVNKHSGILTGLTEGTTTVYVFFTPIPTPTENPDDPCADPFATAEITVTVANLIPPDYGYQGLDNAIIMSPAPDEWHLTGGDWWNTYQNSFRPDGKGYIQFTYTSLAGFKGQSRESYSDSSYNGNYVVIRDGNFDVVTNGYLADYDYDNWEGVLGIGPNDEDFDEDTNTITLYVDTSTLTPNETYSLYFFEDFRGNNINRTLGQNINFKFYFN